jgi:hypothetical protein
MDTPRQREGDKTDNQHSIRLPDAVEAATFYKEAKARLLEVNAWKAFSGLQSAEFTVCDSDGNPLNRAVSKGDMIRINIPGPGSASGDGFDWVSVISIEENSSPSNESIVMTVRPGSNPRTPGNDTAHFFQSDATSTFVVRRDNNTVTAEVHGRNEIPNTETSKNVDKVRNSVVAVSASKFFADIQWSALVKGLLTYR